MGDKWRNPNDPWGLISEDVDEDVTEFEDVSDDLEEDDDDDIVGELADILGEEGNGKKKMNGKNGDDDDDDEDEDEDDEEEVEEAWLSLSHRDVLDLTEDVQRGYDARDVVEAFVRSMLDDDTKQVATEAVEKWSNL